MIITPQQFALAAREYLGVPFVHQGRSKQGVDCAGLILCALQDCGWEAQGLTAVLTEYGRMPDTGTVKEALMQECVSVEFEDLQVGDLVGFGWRVGSGEAVHLAIVTDVQPEQTLILHNHYLMGNRKVSEHGLDDTWQGRMVAAYRLKCFAGT